MPRCTPYIAISLYILGWLKKPNLSLTRYKITLNSESVAFSMVFRWAHRYIHRNWDQVFLVDGIYSLDCPIYHWTEAIPVRLTVPTFSYRMPFQRDAMLAMPYQSHSHRTVEPRERIDACQVPSIGHASLAPKIVPDDFSKWPRFAGSLDVEGCLYAFPGAENQMYRSMVRIDNMRQHHEPTHTFALVLCGHWNKVSCVPNRQHGYRNLF